MSEPHIVIREEKRKRSGPPPAPNPAAAWVLVGLLGGTFLVIGGADLVLTWIPFRLGDPEWEFGTISATLDHLPLPTMGAAFLLAASVSRGWRLAARIVSGSFWIAAAFLLVLGLIYATNIPLALRSVQDPMVQLGLKKAVTKAALQILLYPIAFLWLGARAWKAVRGAVTPAR